MSYSNSSVDLSNHCGHGISIQVPCVACAKLFETLDNANLRKLRKEHQELRHLLARALSKLQGGHEPGIQNDILEALELYKGGSNE